MGPDHIAAATTGTVHADPESLLELCGFLVAKRGDVRRSRPINTMLIVASVFMSIFFVLLLWLA
jgi:hypothetical protein